MRIGILADPYLPHVSGITVFVSLYRKTLESFGHEAHVFTSGPAGHPQPDLRVLRTTGIPIQKTGNYSGPRHGSRNRELIRSMDLLHTMDPTVGADQRPPPRDPAASGKSASPFSGERTTHGVG